ncbi:MAG TPA: S41 family peptidase [Gemmatimonadaceae bacterium]|nr:S41 family peptidase [Gemmatimonadaceae bacterium]
MTSRFGRWVLVVGVVAGAVGCARSRGSTSAAPAAASIAAAAPVQDTTPLRAAETFDAAWRIIHETHFDTTFNGVDWQALRTELRPRAEAARSRAELRGVIRDMIGRLRQSHFSLIPAEAVDEMSATRSPGNGGGGGPGDLGFEMRLIGDTFVVSRVMPGGAAAGAGVRPGWTVVSVGGQRLSELRGRMPKELAESHARTRAAYAAMGLLGGSAGSSVPVEFRDGRDKRVARTLQRRPETGDSVRFGNLPVVYTRFESERLTPAGGPRVGVIRFNIWMARILPQFDAAIDSMRGMDGIVIDIRGNPGGVGALVMGTAGHFLTQESKLGTMKLRRGDLNYVANPRRVNASGQRVEPFAGPVAILTDRLSASTSEVFAGGLQAVGRARVIGDTSAGQALPALMERLPNNDVLYHAYADFTTPTGDRLEGRGVIPDEVVPLTRKALLEGHDPALEAAVRWIASRRGTAGAASAPRPSRN